VRLQSYMTQHPKIAISPRGEHWHHNDRTAGALTTASAAPRSGSASLWKLAWECGIALVSCHVTSLLYPT